MKQPQLCLFSEASATLPQLTGMADGELIALFGTVGRAVADRCLKKRACVSSWSLVLDYLRSAMAFEAREQFRILFLDKRNQLIADEVQQTGTVDHVPVYPREVLRRAIELHATAIIIAHNHPSGDPTPSAADIAMTEKLRTVLKTLDITLHDHVIVARDGHASFKALKLMGAQS